MKLIPSIDLLKGSVVRLKKGDPSQVTIYSSEPVEVAKQWVSDGADILHIADLDAAFNRGQNIQFIEEIIQTVGAKVQVGGGVRRLDQAASLLQRGAWRVVLGTLAYTNPDLLTDLLNSFGVERLVVALDYESGRVKIKGWRSFTDEGVLDALNRFRARGVKSFLMTAVERDGLLNGPDLETLSSASNMTGVEVTASGGIRRVDDLLDLKRVGVWGAIVGRALYDGKISLKEAFSILKEERM